MIQLVQSRLARPRWGRYARSAAGSTARVLRRGLTAYWHAPLGSTGTEFRDVGPYQSHGTLTNMNASTDWVLGQKGHALDIKGPLLGHRVDCGNPASINAVTAQLTASILAKIYTGSRHNGLFAKGRDTAWGFWQYSDNSQYARMKLGGTTRSMNGSPIALDTWVEIGYTYDGSTVKFWQDGVYTGDSWSYSGAISTNAVNVTIGSLDAGAYPAAARIARVGLWNRALTPAEMLLHAKSDAIIRPRQWIFTATGGGAITTSPDTVAITATVPTLGTAKALSPSPVEATWSVPAVTTSKQVATGPAGMTMSVPEVSAALSSAAAGPYRVDAGRTWLCGTVARNLFATNVQAGHTFHSGATSGSIHG
ncbi:MAG: LamG domain-containing protein, partial [Planctomycetes bacterium]|nr:LamG domain-containing protein [Planctomycetota bacterium]